MIITSPKKSYAVLLNHFCKKSARFSQILNLNQNGYNFSIKVPYCAHNGSRTNFPSQGHLSLKTSAIFSKIQPCFQKFSQNSQFWLSFVSVWIISKKSHATYPFTVKWVIIYFSWTNFATSKKSKIQPFLSLKFNRKIGGNLWSWAKNRSQT